MFPESEEGGINAPNSPVVSISCSHGSVYHFCSLLYGERLPRSQPTAALVCGCQKVSEGGLALVSQLSTAVGSSPKPQICLSFSFEMRQCLAMSNLELAVFLPLEITGVCHHMPSRITF